MAETDQVSKEVLFEVAKERDLDPKLLEEILDLERKNLHLTRPHVKKEIQKIIAKHAKKTGPRG